MSHIIYSEYCVFLKNNAYRMNQEDVRDEPARFKSHLAEIQKICELGVYKERNLEFYKKHNPLKLKLFIEENVERAGDCVYSEARGFYLRAIREALGEIEPATKLMLEGHEIRHSLIIRMPWIKLILNGLKTWELRATRTNKHGWIGLIQQGTGQITGIARLAQVVGPYTVEDLEKYQAKHCVDVKDPKFQKWRFAWIFKDVMWIEPVPYFHKRGAVVWVKH